MTINKSSTKDNPIGFFEYFMQEGFIKFYNNFFGISDKFYNSVLIAEDKTAIAKDDNNNDEDGIWSITQEEHEMGASGTYIIFVDELYSLLKEQQALSLSLIQDTLLHSTGKEQVKYYFETLSFRIIKLIKKHPTSSLMSKYYIISYFLKSMVKEIYQLLPFSISINEVEEPLKSILDQDSTLQIPKTQRNLTMKTEFFSKIETLFKRLVAEGFIKDTHYNEFKNAFNGNQLPEAPLLQWKKIAFRSKTVSKPLIIFFVRTLIEKSIIDPLTDKELIIVIPRIFIDHNNRPLEHIKVSISEMKNRVRLTEDEKLLESIISEFAQTK